jgi:enamine deaminase RidA (YjgF/YER057c/UK114 family)
MAANIPSPDKVHPPFGLYTHAIAVPAGADLLYISGQVGTRPDGVTPPAIGDQADQIFQNIGAILEANGMGFAHIVKLTTFIVGADPEGGVRAARLKRLGDHRPCSTAVFVSALVGPEWLVEIEAIAAKPAA